MMENDWAVVLLQLLVLIFMFWIVWTGTGYLASKIQAIWIGEQAVSSSKRKSVSSLSSFSIASISSLDRSWSTSSYDDEASGLLEDASLSRANATVAFSITCEEEAWSEWENQEPWVAYEEGEEDNSSDVGSVKPDAKIHRYLIGNQRELNVSTSTSQSSFTLNGSTQVSLQSKNPTTLEYTRQFQEAIVAKGDIFQEERLSLPKPPAQKAHHPQRIPCPAVDVGTMQHLEININKKQLQKLLGEATPFTHPLAKLNDHGTGQQEIFSTRKPDSADKSEAIPLTQQLRQDVFQQLSEMYLHVKSLQSSERNMEGTSKDSELIPLREELLQPRSPSTVLYFKTESVSQGTQMGRAEENRLVEIASVDTSLSDVSCFSGEKLRNSSRNRKPPCRLRKQLPVSCESYKAQRTHQVPHAITSQSLPTSSGTQVRLPPWPKRPGAVERTTELLEAMVTKGDSDQEEMLVLPKLSTHSAHPLPRVPCSVLDSRTRQRLEFHINKKQVQKLWGEAPSSTHCLAKLGDCGTGPQDSFSKQDKSSSKPKSAKAKSEPMTQAQQLRQEISQQPLGFLHGKFLKPSDIDSESTSQESEPQTLREELPQSVSLLSLMTANDSRVTLMSSAEENKLADDRSWSALICSSEDDVKSNGWTTDAPCTLRDHLPISCDSYEIPSTHPDENQDSHSHGMDSAKSHGEAIDPKLPKVSVPDNSSFKEKDIFECQTQLWLTTTVTCHETSVETLSRQTIVKESSGIAKHTPTIITPLPESPSVFQPREKESHCAKTHMSSATSLEKRCAAQGSWKGRNGDGRVFIWDERMPNSHTPGEQISSFQLEQLRHGGNQGPVMAALLPKFQEPPRGLSRHQLECSILASLSMKKVVKDLRQSVIRGLEIVDGVLRAEYPVCNSCGTCSPCCSHPRSECDPLLHIYPRITVRNGQVHMHLNCQLKIKQTHAKNWGLLETGVVNVLKEQRKEPDCNSSSGWESIPVEWPSSGPGKLLNSVAKQYHVGTICQAQRDASDRLRSKVKSSLPLSEPQQLQQAPARGKQDQAKQHPNYDDSPKTMLCQKLKHSVLSSMNVDQLVKDLHLSIHHGSEKKCQELKSKCSVCCLCGSCRPSCPHPRSLEDGTLLLYPRLAVRGGQLRMDLDFYLKMKRNHARKWGLMKAMEAHTVQTPHPRGEAKFRVSSSLTERWSVKRRRTEVNSSQPSYIHQPLKNVQVRAEHRQMDSCEGKNAGTTKLPINLMKRMLLAIKKAWQKHVNKFTKKPQKS